MILKNKLFIFYIVLLMGILTACNNASNSTESNNVQNAIQPPIALNYDIIKLHPHDTSSYTEGLEWDENRLIESTGNYKQSKLRVLDSNMKDVMKPVNLNESLFGEGVTKMNGKIYQLTWKENKVLVYDAKTLVKTNEFNWPYEGWGMTHDDTSIIINTGGSNIYYVDPATFNVKKTLGVFNNYGYVSNINELEYVNGKLYGNVYMTDNIIRIDPITGRVEAVADFSNILTKVGIKEDPKTKDPGNVLNGIAYHKKKGTFYITGKDWPVLIELTFK